MKFSGSNIRKKRNDRLPKDGEHEAVLAKIAKAHKDTGDYLVLTFKLADGRLVPFWAMLKPSAGHEDLEDLSYRHQALIADFLMATLGTDEVDDLLSALEKAKEKPVLVTTRQSQKQQQTRVNVDAFRAADAVKEGGK